MQPAGLNAANVAGQGTGAGVIRQPLLSTDAHVMGASEATYVDPIMASRLAAARQAGYDQGFAEGARAAESGARRSAETALARLRLGVEEARAALASTTAASVPGLVDLAVDIAKHIVDEVPDELRASLMRRLAEAIDQLDTDDMVVVVNPADLGVVRSAVGEVDGLTIREDPRIAQGGARIDSRWARADLTLGTAWELVEASVRG